MAYVSFTPQDTLIVSRLSCNTSDLPFPALQWGLWWFDRLRRWHRSRRRTGNSSAGPRPWAPCRQHSKSRTTSEEQIRKEHGPGNTVETSRFSAMPAGFYWRILNRRRVSAEEWEWGRSEDEVTRAEMPRRFLAHTALVIALLHLGNNEMLGYIRVRLETNWLPYTPLWCVVVRPLLHTRSRHSCQDTSLLKPLTFLKSHKRSLLKHIFIFPYSSNMFSVILHMS